MAKRLLLINPWIYDFSAHDLWIKPLGLLELAAILEKNGYLLNFIDCLDRYHPQLLKLKNRKTAKTTKYGCGKYFKQVLPKPAPIKHIPRHYGRYGMPPEIFCRELDRIPAPDGVLVTSGMTYWYPGVFEAIQRVRNKFSNIPIILGGIYASLCPEHAKVHSGADLVIEGCDISRIVSSITNLIGRATTTSPTWIPSAPDELPYPAYHLMAKTPYICLRSSYGCPFACNYCASGLIHPYFKQQSPAMTIAQIVHFYQNMHIMNFAFYDDALLVNAEHHLQPVLDSIIEHSIKANFHTPNALHARYITQILADKLYKAGFKTINLGFESADSKWQIISGGKITNTELKTAVRHLLKAGYKQNDIGVYILLGLPGVPLKEVMKTVTFVLGCGAKPILTEFSPIPKTGLWEAHQNLYDQAAEEPLLQNNSLLGYYPVMQPDLLKLKHTVKMLNLRLQPG
jgi:radical SAM superfamily enzyme YgiQ (UPF0313 family)